VVFRDPLRTAVVSARPRKPCAVHFDTEHDNHWVAKIPGCVSPLVDVCIPLSGKNLSQTELVRAAIFLVRPVPWRPENQRQRAVPPNDVEIVGREILFSPIARRSDDGLMFSDHLLEILD